MTKSVLLHHQQQTDEKTLLGFWIYLMSDCILFATLFACYAILHTNTFGGPSSKELFDLPSVLLETLFLLISSFTCGLASFAAYRKSKKGVLLWYAITFLLGIGFLTIEAKEFIQLVHEGHSWRQSAFLSSFFTLVGTHGLHISVGLLGMLILMPQVIKWGFSGPVMRRLYCLKLFWHFLDVVWIFIFTFVYLLGAK